MRQLNCKKVGLATGALVALWHVLWSLLVALGWAHGLLSWVLQMHFLTNPYGMIQFSLLHAAALVAVTGGVGFLFGYCFALIWNWLNQAE